MKVGHAQTEPLAYFKPAAWRHLGHNRETNSEKVLAREADASDDLRLRSGWWCSVGDLSESTDVLCISLRLACSMEVVACDVVLGVGCSFVFWLTLVICART